MRWLAFALIVLVPLPAAADALMPAPESCPPGLDARTSHRGPTCGRRRCTRDADCGEGAACVDAAFCQREREVPNHRRGGTRITTETGPSCLNAECPEAVAIRGREPVPWECRRWRWCEPTVRTPAWDPEAHAWTGEPHVVLPDPEPEPEPEPEPPPAERETAAEPEEESAGGCAIGVDGIRAPGGLALLLLGLTRARRRVGRRRRARGR